MFTGLIKAVGEVESFTGDRLLVSVAQWPSEDEPIKSGESIAINGCCLTTIETAGLVFELSPETVRRTGFSRLGRGDLVNVERAMRASDRFGGHIVQGHVDTTGELVEIENLGEYHRFHYRLSREFDRYLIDKGSISIDGISLTIVEPRQGEFDCWIIPHTIANTNMRSQKGGEVVNIEFDVLAKHVEKLLSSRSE